MFSRRKGSKKVPIDRSTSAAGATAAQLAFFQKSSNAPPLSSAAAAAALRSHTSTPEPVGSLQTKRMMRRGSNSSMGSGSVATGGERPGGLVRTNSGASMTERTFRSPSPRWNASARSEQIPPVPPLPRTADRPSSSLGTAQRMTSPTPAEGQRSSSADGGVYVPPRASWQGNRLSNVVEREELDKAHSDFARNFSRRDFTPPSSPTTTAMTTQQYDQSTLGAANTYANGTSSSYVQASGDIPRTARSQASHGVPNSRSSSMSSFTLPPNQPYQGTRPVSATGSRASYGQQRNYGIPPGSAYQQPLKVYDPNSRTFVTKTPAQPTQQPALQAARRAKSMETVYDPNSRTFVPKPDAPRNESGRSTPQSTASDFSPMTAPRKQRSFPADRNAVSPPPKNPARFSSFTIEPRKEPGSPRAATTLQKQPFLVQEDFEAERKAEVSASPPSRSVASTQSSQPTVLPAKTYIGPAIAKERSSSLDVPRGSLDTGARGRNVSQSPQRSAHFSPSPILQPERHAPPPRDISPAKSAMKQPSPAPSVGRSSPLGTLPLYGKIGGSGPASDTSETPSLSGVNGKKKKSARVSFDEQPREIGTPATTVIPTTTRDRSPELSGDMDDDGMMKPRPALPSFGSVRRDRVQAAPAEKVTEMPPERHEVSSDLAIGGILRDSREPLPPEVTSKETSGYVSDESSEADVPVPSAAVVPSVPAMESKKLEADVPVASAGVVPSIAATESKKLEEKDVPLTGTGQPTIRDFAGVPPVQDRAGGLAVDDKDVPAIALLPPTPGFDEEAKRDLVNLGDNEMWDETRGRNSMEGISVPGSWSYDVEEALKTTSVEPSSIEPVQPTPIPPTLQRSSSTEDSAATMTVTPIQLTQSPQPLSDIDEDTSDAEFSDAFEDPSDFEDEGGFASLDAIVESPMPSPMETRTIPVVEREGDVPESPSVKQVTKSPEVFTGSAPVLNQALNLGDMYPVSDEPPSPTSSPPDWKQATTYWSQLSREKRAQIEREALSSDEELVPARVPPRKVKQKKARNLSLDTTRPTSGTARESAPPALKKTMRAQTGPVAAAPASDDRVHLRSSMRSGGNMAPTLRDGPSPRRQQPERPTSSGGLSTSSTGKPMPVGRPWSLTSRPSEDSIYSQEGPPVKKTIQRPKVETPKKEPPKVSARLAKELEKANESDSESSFKKRRKGAGRVDPQGRYTMRRSMRSGSVDQAIVPEVDNRRSETPTSERGGRFGFRSMSPTFGRGKPSTRESSQDSHMRTSLRGPPSKPAARDSSQDSGMRTSLRGAPSKGAESGMKSSLRGAGPRPAQTQTKAPLSKLKLNSRFEDSDDEDIDAPRPTFFKSRFADSDDESEPASPRPGRADLTPVRGIPRRKGQEDGDSTDLEDERDDNPAETASKRFTGLIGPHPAEMDKVMAAARRNLGMSEDSSPAHDVKEGELLQKGSLRQPPQSPTTAKDTKFAPEDKKKKGFMSTILRRNRNSASAVPQLMPSSPANRPTSPLAAPGTPQTPKQEQPVRPASPLAAVAPASPKIERPTSPGPPTGKLLRRESYQMWMQRTQGDTSMGSPPTTPGPATNSSALQGREIDGMVIPPPPPIPEDEPRPSPGERPVTSDGVSPEAIKLARTMRPDLARNTVSGPIPGRTVRIQAGEEGSEPGERDSKGIYSQKTGKKKKFGMIRKVFGLKD